MPLEPTLDIARLRNLLNRFQTGDEEAGDALLRAVYDRLERLTQQMLRNYPNVRRWCDASDVLHGALVRMLRSLKAVRPAEVRDFLNIAALNIRRELLDLTRRFHGHKIQPVGDVEENENSPLAQAPAPAEAPDLDLWSGFHELVEQLPCKEREVMSLAFYHGWTQAQIAELLGIDERTVRRHWRSACLILSDALHQRLPDV
jgi:RNA polymerase sigma factor (sigma-70 family)